MQQLVFKFPFKINYSKKDFFVSKSNFEAYKLIESWPNWPDKWINIFGPKGCGKTHLTMILKNKINIKILNPEDLDSNFESKLNNFDFFVIENYENNINEEILFSFLNFMKLKDSFLLINSSQSLKSLKIKLNDLKSRLKSFIELGINLPDDDMVQVIILKNFSDKQISINNNVLNYIIKNIDRSYENIFKFLRDIDKESLVSGNAISINMVKKFL